MLNDFDQGHLVFYPRKLWQDTWLSCWLNLFVSLFVIRRWGRQDVLWPCSDYLDLNLVRSLALITLYCISLFQSAAMEETVIWEQHTVTLHRVGICHPLSDAPLQLVLVPVSLYPACFAVFASILHPCILPHLISGSHHVGSVLSVYTVAGATDKTEHYYRAFLLQDSLNNLHKTAVCACFYKQATQKKPTRFSYACWQWKKILL